MSARTASAAFAASLLLALLTTGAAQAAATGPGTAEGAELVKTGWWWAANDTPLDDSALAPPQPRAPNVPDGALPVSAAGGDPEKVSALEFRLSGDGPVGSATLVLQESTQPGATVNAAGASVVACLVTEAFWADGAAASWKSRPAYDCEAAGAPGERDAETGVWTFDLTAVAAAWTTEGHTGSTSVALVEAVDAPVGFQVSFDGPQDGGVGYAFAQGDAGPDDGTSTGGKGAGGSGGSDASGSGTASGGGAGGAGGGTGTSSGSLTDTGGDLGGTDTGPLPGTAEVAPLEDAALADDSAVAAPAVSAATTPVAALGPPPWYSGIPAAGYALLPLTLGLAYLLMLALGPDAQPAAGPTQHGVGRALERLRAAGATVTSRRKK